MTKEEQELFNAYKEECEDNKWIEKATVGAVDKVQWERLVKYGTF